MVYRLAYAPDAHRSEVQFRLPHKIIISIEIKRRDIIIIIISIAK